MANEVSKTNSCGVFALVMAVLSVILPVSAMPLGVIGGLVLAVLGLIFGIIQARKAGNAWATSAIVISIIGLIVNIFFIVALLAVVNSALSSLQQSGLLDQVGANA